MSPFFFHNRLIQSMTKRAHLQQPARGRRNKRSFKYPMGAFKYFFVLTFSFLKRLRFYPNASLNRLVLYSKLVKQKSVHICNLFDAFAQGCSHTVTRAGACSQ